MRVTVRLFAAPREVLGKAQIEENVAPGSTVEELLTQLSLAFPSLTPYLGAITVAVNQRYADLRTELHEGDEVALVPPVGGG